jgi:methionyl-tRNA formyltransferase
LAPLGAKLILTALEKLERGELREVAQDDSLATLAPMLKKSDGILDFAANSAAVVNRARGVDPWPGASTSLSDGSPLKLFGARRAGEGGEAGVVVAVDGRGVVVACGQGAAAFREVQAAGRKRMAAVDFARGGGLTKGMKLGRT